jgi:hypothetical protein
MAYTVTRQQSVFGNMRAVLMEVTADAATQVIETGLGKIVGFSYAPKSMNSSNIHMAINSSATGVQSYGVFSVTGCTSGDNFHVVVYGS